MVNGVAQAAGDFGLSRAREYLKKYEAAKSEAANLSIDYLKGYLQGYESRLTRRSKVWYKIFGEQPQIEAFREEISKRKELSDRL